MPARALQADTREERAVRAIIDLFELQKMRTKRSRTKRAKRRSFFFSNDPAIDTCAKSFEVMSFSHMHMDSGWLPSLSSIELRVILQTAFRELVDLRHEFLRVRVDACHVERN